MYRSFSLSLSPSLSKFRAICVTLVHHKLGKESKEIIYTLYIIICYYYIL
jgi:hypothetical protein